MAPSPEFDQRPPRILQCVSHLALGGAERVAITLTDALRAEASFAVCAIRGLGDGDMGLALEHELAALRVPLFTGPSVPMRQGGVLTGALTLRRAIRSFAPDVIHLHTEIPEASYGILRWLQPRLRTIPVLRTIHNSVFWGHWRPLGRWCDRHLSAAHVVGVSRDAVAAFHQLRRDSGAAEPAFLPTLIYNGVTEPAARLPSPRRPSDPIRIVFGGRFEREKGTDLLPEILSRVRIPPNRRVQLTLFGSGRHQALLNELAHRPPANWSIAVQPPTPAFREKLMDADLLIIPSRFEGLGLVAIEAFLAGIPVIATDAPGLREVLPPGYAWFAKPDDAGTFAAVLSEALDSPERWGHLAAQGRDFARARFGVATMAEAYRCVYRRMLPPGLNALVASTGPAVSTP